MAKNDISLCTTGKRWYVQCYVFEHGKQKRQRHYGFVNREKDPVKRLEKLNSLADSIRTKIAMDNADVNTLLWYLRKTIKDSLHLKQTTRASYKVHLAAFARFLTQTKQTHIMPHQFTPDILHQYVTWLLKKRENRTVNNYVITLNTLINILKKYHRLKIDNPCQTFNRLPAHSRMHVAYTPDQAASISSYLQKNDPELLLYIRFISYAFVRCNEARLIRIKYIDFNSMTIKMPTHSVKTNESRNKTILKLFYPEIKKLQNELSDFYVFGMGGRPGNKPVSKKHFTEKFKLIKKQFGLSRYHTLYGFRHTIISQLIKNGADRYEVMKYTGHTTLSAFEKYIKSIFAEPPKDLSDKITVII